MESVQFATISTERKKHKEDELSEEEKTVLLSISGKLLWASTQTRPDLVYDACIVANHGKKPTLKKLLGANKAIRKLKAVDVVLKFPHQTRYQSCVILMLHMQVCPVDLPKVPSSYS